MVLGLKPMGKLGNQVQKMKKLQVLDRTRALYGPRTQANGETNYLNKKKKKKKSLSFVIFAT